MTAPEQDVTPAEEPEPVIDPDVPLPSEWSEQMKIILGELETLRRAKDLSGGSSVTDAGHDYQIAQDLLVDLEHALKQEFAARLVGQTRKVTRDKTGRDWDPYT